MNALTRTIRRYQWKRRYSGLLSELADDPTLRMKAHAKRLKEYFLRWLGFCRLDLDSPQSLIDNNLFIIVEAASSIAEQDLARFRGSDLQSIRQAWNEYQSSLRSLRKCPPDFNIQAEQSFQRLNAFTSAVELQWPASNGEA